ncbi:3-phosphoshikimate 1-carboxyvinyltransferase [Falsibacillus albus]|uniref:3-phosphoshikimate 1-carboxyvinyltransferase n=1 Tax=Falsibacillus albus TaxID=2478915 RepID=A0A3L7JXT0_9BACI|nr:3-phosphoshikimate 1-carboxyvinyltransferase [Falsibacillus albus]RLQ95105.1 3-phosphoshikimate 1-carboxyvinyltransferase [Falsibacillus albus]
MAIETTSEKSLNGQIQIPGDKSISHRAVMFGAISNGKTKIKNFLFGEDCLSTVECFRKLGVDIEVSDAEINIDGKGFEGLKEPAEILNVGNSGTTTRLIMGILAGLPIHSVLIGDDSIAKRPMSRVAIPLKSMGAQIDGRENGQYTPLAIRGTNLNGIQYTLPVASAQVKSAILLAAIQAKGTSIVKEPQITRDHTERMIRQFGGSIEKVGDEIIVKGGQSLSGCEIKVPGDISSAAFFMVAAAIAKNSRVEMPNVGLNPTRSGIIEVFEKMGASITVQKDETGEAEPTGTIIVETSTLQGIEIGGELIPKLIDEIPIIALLATQASGRTVIRNAEELKVKETNRIDTVVHELQKLGANITATEDGMIIEGNSKLSGGTVDSHGDHRIGMMLAVASVISEGDVEILRKEAINVSYPNFFNHLEQLSN